MCASCLPEQDRFRFPDNPAEMPPERPQAQVSNPHLAPAQNLLCASTDLRARGMQLGKLAAVGFVRLTGTTWRWGAVVRVCGCRSTAHLGGWLRHSGTATPPASQVPHVPATCSEPAEQMPSIGFAFWYLIRECPVVGVPPTLLDRAGPLVASKLAHAKALVYMKPRPDGAGFVAA